MSYLYSNSESPIKNIKVLRNESLSSTEVLYEEHTLIPGTEISYCPTHDATHVLYDASFAINYDPGGSIRGSYMLQEYNESASSWQNMDGYLFNFSATHNKPGLNEPFRVNFLLLSWFGIKKLRLVAASLDSRVFSVNMFKHPDNTVTDDERYIHCIVKCSSLVSE